MAFVIDRVEAARRLSVSTRTVDRYIQMWRIQTKRIGKKMFLDEDDVEIIRKTAPEWEEDYIVLEKSDISHEIVSRSSRELQTRDENIPDFSLLFEDAQKSLARKDEIIQDLSYRLWKAETELKNSIPLVEYKKATFLLESAKTRTDADTTILQNKIDILEKDAKTRTSYMYGITLFFILMLVLFVLAIYFLYSQFSVGG